MIHTKKVHQMVGFQLGMLFFTGYCSAVAPDAPQCLRPTVIHRGFYVTSIPHLWII